VRFENLEGFEEQSYALSSVTSIQFVGGNGDDLFVNSSAIATVAWGNSGNDTLRGGLGNDRIFGGAGNDALYGDSGDDELRGEDGDDTLSGENGVDLLIGSIGNDQRRRGQ
jgi:Ca2+-binding RTX toxin-like protein